MKYMMMFIGSDEGSASLPAEERQHRYAAIGEWWSQHAGAGRILDGQELQAGGTATTVRLDGGKPIVIDGPFMEAKERIGGFALIEVRDLDEALQMAKTWPAGGAVEVRPLVTEH
jgi:hypothetical protein